MKRPNDQTVLGFYDTRWDHPSKGSIRIFYRGDTQLEGAVEVYSGGKKPVLVGYEIRRSFDPNDFSDHQARLDVATRIKEDLERFGDGDPWLIGYYGGSFYAEEDSEEYGDEWHSIPLQDAKRQRSLERYDLEDIFEALVEMEGSPGA